MASLASFDIVSTYDEQELKNALDQARRDVQTRYDLKDTKTEIDHSGSEITITTDSAYVKNGVTNWIHGWKRNGWKTADRKPVKNVDLWQRLDAAQSRHQVNWEWIKGHAGHPENERADELARAGMAPYKP